MPKLSHTINKIFDFLPASLIAVGALIITLNISAIISIDQLTLNEIQILKGAILKGLLVMLVSPIVIFLFLNRIELLSNLNASDKKEIKKYTDKANPTLYFCALFIISVNTVMVFESIQSPVRIIEDRLVK